MPDISSSFVVILATVGMSLAFWRQIKALLARPVSVAIGTATVLPSPLASAIRSHCMAHASAPSLRPRSFSSMNLFVRPRQGVESVALERFSGTLFLWNRGRPLVIRTGRENDKGTIRLHYFRGSLNLDKFIIDVMDKWNELLRSGQRRRYRVTHIVGRAGSMGVTPPAQGGGDGLKPPTHALLETSPLQWSFDELGPPIRESSATDDLVLCPDAKEAIQEARFWVRNGDRYRERSIPWRRGWLLHGSPGMGKTSLARAVAEDLDLPVFALDLSSLTNEEMRRAWTSMLNETPCMALLEDLDAVFHGRKNVTGRRDGLTFDTLLNCIDGIQTCDGVFLVVTTNELLKIDPAIGGTGVDGANGPATRPGRIDRVIEMSSPSVADLARMGHRILPGQEDMCETLAQESLAQKESIAQFQERCSRLALHHLWAPRTPAEPKIGLNKT